LTGARANAQDRPVARRLNRNDPWFVPLLLAIATGCGSFAFFAYTLADIAADREGSAAATGREPPAPARQPLRYSGELPPSLADAGFSPAGSGGADIRFAGGTGPGAGTPTRYWAWVASPHAGVDSLTGAQLQRALQGTEGPEAAGGIGPRWVFAATAGDVERVRALTGHSGTVGPRDTYGALAAEMADSRSPPLLALVPLEAVTPSMMAVAVDGVDLVRGHGDPATWPWVERIEVTGLSERGRREAPLIQARTAAMLPPVTTIVATGDILMSRCTLARIRAGGDWGAPLRSPVGEYLAAADLALGSLDGSIQDIGEPYGCIATTNLTSPPEVIEALTLAGFDGLTLATNHIADCGEGACGMRALMRTLELVHEAGIKTVGAGGDLEGALAPAVFEVKGVLIGVLGFDDIAAEDLEATATGPGTAPLDDTYEDDRADLPREPAFYKPAALLSVTRLEERVRALRQQVDIVIVQVQSGTEDTHDPSERSIKALRTAAAAGADLVVGNQAHWVQAVEFRGNSVVTYALGNFIFDQQHTPEHEQGYLVEATVQGRRLVNVRLLPYRIKEQIRPTFVEGAERAKILEDVWAAARRLAVKTP
jgi:poly-gamma-glutamate capsule biosynthesis protein CapA/YwtB (metallophosphatase superfamily)